VTRFVLALVALLALVDFLRHRERVRLDVALMLASLGIPVLRQFSPDTVSDLRWVRTFLSMVVVAQPYLLLRLVEDFRPVARTYIGVAIAGMVLSWVALAVYAPPLPQSVTLIIIAYFILMEGYAALAFVRGMLATRGPTRWRLGFAAGGSGLLAVAILLAGIVNLVPGASGATMTLRPLLSALAAVSYYLGFTPPGWLTRTWQLPELHRFLQAIAGVSAAERSTKTAQALCQTASRVAGGLASAVYLWDEEQQQLKVEVAEVAALRSGPLSPAEGVTGQVWTEQRAAAVKVQTNLGREENQMAALLGAKALLVVPIRSGQRAWGLLLVFHIRGPLFPSDDLSLLAILGEQYALALHNADQVAQQNDLVAQLEAANQRIRLILETTQEAFIAMDAKGSITDWNKEAEAIFGWPREEILTQPLYEIIIPPQYREAHRRGLQHFLATGEGPVLNQRLELDALGRDGNEFPVELTITPVREGDSYIFNAFLHDITERKQAEQTIKARTAQLEAANKDLERFAYLASHDLQEPLRMISSFAELLSERYTNRLDADAGEFIGYMVDSANRMRELISGLLAFSRLQTQGQPLETIAAEEAFHRAIANLQVAIKESRALVTHDPLPQVLGDTTQLMQVFQNLIGNAIKFCTQDVPRVHVSAHESGKEWLISVKDNGIGIAPQFHRRIFEIFQRLHGRAEYSGTGLGLALCQRIIERHGGRIWVESELGQGSTFHLTLPLAERPEDVTVDRSLSE
jgi:PAS domain S-box-containing protein